MILFDGNTFRRTRRKKRFSFSAEVVSLLEKIQAEIEEEGKAEAKGYDESGSAATGFP